MVHVMPPHLTSSDRDLKDNIQVIDNATDRIRKMNGYTYTLKENGMPYAGVIAQKLWKQSQKL
ncbi:hypothetical protein ECZU41_13810 [Escherichia coli]|nr:hypothetical protein ECZU41_13810 [Escherichia coli]